MDGLPNAKLRALPQLQKLLDLPEGQACVARFSHAAVAEALRRVLDEVRAELRRGEPVAVPDPRALLDRAGSALAAAARAAPRLRRVINATGIVLHTNLGRAPLAAEAMAAVAEAAGYCTLEFDLGSGGRGSRTPGPRAAAAQPDRGRGGAGGQQLRRRGAAGASGLAGGRRGDRVARRAGRDRRRLPHPGRDPAGRRPAGGGRHHQQDPAGGLRARHHAGDPRAAEGAPEQLPHHRLHRGGAAARTGGAGARDGACWWCTIWAAAPWDCALGRRAEPTVRTASPPGSTWWRSAATSCCGGPQSGLLAGGQRPIDTLRRHPLLRALRLDKLTLAALEATLRLHRDGAREAGCPCCA